MTHFKWLKKEIPRWVKEEIITREAGDSLISLYRNEQRHSHGEGLFVLACCMFPHRSNFHLRRRMERSFSG